MEVGRREFEGADEMLLPSHQGQRNTGVSAASSAASGTWGWGLGRGLRGLAGGRGPLQREEGCYGPEDGFCLLR